MFLVASPILAHVSPEHILSYSSEATEIWKILSVAVFMLGLVALITYMSKDLSVNTK
jgi:hypothetical protein